LAQRLLTLETVSLVNYYLSKTGEVVMKKHLFPRIVVVGAVVMLMGFGVNAFAGTDKGNENPGQAAVSAKMTDDQIKQMETKRNEFQTATAGIRQQLNEKRQGLQAELAKQAPDATKCMALQKEVSELQAQFDQKRVTHILEMKKIDPNFTEGRGMGHPMGRGMGNNPFGGPNSPFGGQKTN
jgi:Spy/CpxP family protein refolding chaperone